ncbi:MAG: diacylglycerol kinase family lipid kinase [Deltaproteobacteria bacterium]|nr:diacylglycerol kinase family lipid kinase [Deltaproteobacteria bacterium]MBW2418122.1 diacylglycerol kinase family lipid kinase [Deltaproteobacteria bacterium]
MPAQTLVISNPASRSGATGRRWGEVEARLRAALGELAVERTRGPRDGERIAREAAQSGARRIVVAGGDGTANEVVSGLLAADLASKVEVGLLPLGTGGDFLRTLGIPRTLDAAIAALRLGKTRCVDAGRLRYRDRAGEERVGYFLNVTSFGISGLVDVLVNQAPKFLGGRVSFFIGTLRGIVRYRAEEVAIRVDGELVHEGPLALAAAANGRYFGGGMQIAPEARLDDGQLDVVVVGGASKARLLARFPSLYRGTHLRHPEASWCRGTCIEASAAPGRVWLDVDGDPLGTLPVTLEVLPRALTLFGVESVEGVEGAEAAERD